MDLAQEKLLFPEEALAILFTFRGSLNLAPSFPPFAFLAL